MLIKILAFHDFGGHFMIAQAPFSRSTHCLGSSITLSQICPICLLRIPIPTIKAIKHYSYPRCAIFKMLIYQTLFTILNWSAWRFPLMPKAFTKVRFLYRRQVWSSVLLQNYMQVYTNHLKNNWECNMESCWDKRLPIFHPPTTTLHMNYQGRIQGLK